MLAVMSSPKRKWMVVGAATAAVVGPQLTPATASAELHNVTYIARVDGVAPGSQATFVIHDNETSSTGLSAMPGNAFQANTVLADPSKAGMQISIKWPYSAKVHCEIDVDDNVATQVDQFVSPAPGNAGPMNGVLPCGAPLPS
jgi:hypothetical protein